MIKLIDILNEYSITNPSSPYPTKKDMIRLINNAKIVTNVYLFPPSKQAEQLKSYLSSIGILSNILKLGVVEITEKDFNRLKEKFKK